MLAVRPGRLPRRCATWACSKSRYKAGAERQGHPPGPEDNGFADEPTRLAIAQLRERIQTNTLLPDEQIIADALARIPIEDLPNLGIDPRHLPVARVLGHQVPYARAKYPMDDRQRGNDRLATARWRKVVRRDMMAIGIMPGRMGVSIDGYAARQQWS